MECLPRLKAWRILISNGRISGEPTLVRDFFPKGTDFTKVSKQEVSKIQSWINERPRETLNDKTPIEAIKELLSNINVALASLDYPKNNQNMKIYVHQITKN